MGFGLPPDGFERLVAEALAMLYPWQLKVEKLPDVGVPAPPLPSWGIAANEPHFREGGPRPGQMP